MLKRAVLLLFLVPATALAADPPLLDRLGMVSIAPQLCDLAIDRPTLNARAIAESPDGMARVFRINNIYADAAGAWTAQEQAAFCELAEATAAELDLLES